MLNIDVILELRQNTNRLLGKNTDTIAKYYGIISQLQMEMQILKMSKFYG